MSRGKNGEDAERIRSSFLLTLNLILNNLSTCVEVLFHQKVCIMSEEPQRPADEKTDTIPPPLVLNTLDLFGERREICIEHEAALPPRITRRNKLILQK